MRIVKRILAGLAALIVLSVGAVLIKFYVLSPKYRDAADVKAPSSADAIERGRYLAWHVTACIGCHSEVDVTLSGEPVKPGREGSGRDFGDLPGFPGRVRAQNLTPDRETGIGAWTDGEVLRAMREGVGKDGRTLFPMMPYQSYAKSLSDADSLAIVAYLRTLKPIRNAVGSSSIDFPVSMFIRGVPAPLEQGAPPLPADRLERGKRLLTLASCHDCHDAFDDKRNAIPGRELSGGAEFPIPGKGSIYAANITSDKASGIGAYADEDLIRVFREGKNKSGRQLYAMPWPYYKGLTDDDLEALLLALRQTPPVVNAVPPPTFAAN
jgi:mono/diheme cytochrome c family protein